MNSHETFLIQEISGYIVDLDHFLLDKRKKQSIVEHIGETDLVVANPAKQGKEALSSTRCLAQS